MKISDKYFPNRLELLFMIVWAFPNASNKGFTYVIQTKLFEMIYILDIIGVI